MLHINPFFILFVGWENSYLLIFSIKIRKFIVRCYRWQSYHVLLLMEA
ncbi:hypothetical protein GQF40_00430 [Neisseria meningitidis]|nr:hypothetical protein [Neisseria meningitidis]MBG9065491.1 hypothetical protein [Neisseria meningitidis]MBG9071836.1 hypothetical protein [Neisseria meningitidis]MBG9075469.1 hypothetical protein [Neisseria meningitidis]MBG9075895.1 hypothetical protein [Neisseria meningitidis]